MKIYKLTKYAYFIFLLSFAFILNQKMPDVLGLVEYLLLLIFPMIAMQGVSYHFEQTEQEFEKSFKKTLTRIWFLIIVLTCVLSLLQINQLNKESFFWVAGPLLLPFLGMGFYITFLPILMFFDKKEKLDVE